VPHRIVQEAIHGAMAFLAIHEGVTVLQASGAEESVALLRLMARHVQDRMGQPKAMDRPKVMELS
jgi:ERCC4-type nuclease